MGAEGMVSFIEIVLLFPLAVVVVSESHRDSHQHPHGNLSNLEGVMDKEKVEILSSNFGAEFTHSVEVIQDCQSSGVREKNTHSRVSIEDKHIRRLNIVPIRRKLAEVNCEPHCIEETTNSPVFAKEHDRSFDIEPVPFTVSKADTGGGGIDTTTIIVVVVSTAIVTFLLATLIFCWYTRTYGGVHIDEKPLLSLSRNENPNGSTQEPSYNMQKSVKDFGITSDRLLATKSNLHKVNSTLDSSVSLGIPIEPPPGNLNASGMTPLRPPHGRPALALKMPPGRKDLSVRCPSVNTSSPPIRPPASAAPPVKALSSRRAPSARRPPTAAPPPPPLSGKAPPPPPPLKKGPTPTPPPPPGGGRAPPRPLGVGFRPPHSSSGPGEHDSDDSNKAKLKPFFWDKVMANPDQAMVWHQIRAGSFQFNEETIENLFGYNATEKNKGNNKKNSSHDPSSNFVQIIDSKKAQNLSILLKALNVTTNEVCDALKEGNELPVELIQTLLKMAPTGEEELKLRLYNGDISRLGTAERFLKRLVEIPFAFKRLESLLFMCTLQEEEDIIKESFETLEAACKELRKSRLFLKLLEAVLKTGNRMNDGTFRGSAQAFKLDTLLKLSDVKGVDGKTTLLHFVVLEIIRAEGIRAAKNANENKSFSNFKSDELLEESANSSQDSDEYYRTLGLQAVSSLNGELENVKKAAVLDADGLTGTVSKFGHALTKAREFLNTDLKNIKEKDNDGDGSDDDDDDDDEFAVILSNFVKDAEKDVMWMLEEEKRIMALVKNTADYFHGQPGKDEGLRLFVIIRDFLIILDKVCKEIKNNPLVRPSKTTEKKDDSPSKLTGKKDVLLSQTTTTQVDSESKKTQTENVSEPRMTQTKEVSEPQTAHALEPRMKLTEDLSQPRITQIQDVSEPMMTLAEDVSSYRTQETGDVQHKTWKVDDLRDSWEVNDLQGSWESDNPRNEPQGNEDSQNETPKIENSKHDSYDLQSQIQEICDSKHDDLRQEDHDDLHPKTKETDYSLHETDNSRTQEPADLLYKTEKVIDLQSKTHEDDALQSKTQEDDALKPKIQESDHSPYGTQETDDLQHEMQEIDNSPHETQKNDDFMIPEPDDDSQPRTEENDGLKLEKAYDDDPKHMTDDSQTETQKKDAKATGERSAEQHLFPFRVPHERLIPAIAMRRVDTFSSNSSSEEDEL